MRIDPVHHKLAVFKGDGPGLCHMNFQVASDDVFRNWHLLVDMWLGPTSRPTTQPQLREDAEPGDPAPVPAALPASLSG